MAYTWLNCITDAFYISKIRSPDFQTVGADDTQRGISEMNAILSGMSANTKMVPYYKEYVFPAVIGQEKYFIPGLIEPLSLTFNMQVVRFATTTIGRKKYHGKTRVDGLIALPFENTFEKCLNGSNLYVQLLPAESYIFKIWGKFGLGSISVDDLTTDMLLVYDRWYADFLMHMLIKRLGNFYGVPIGPEVQNTIDTIAANVNDMNPLDLEENKINFYDSAAYPNWVQIQLSRGFTP